MIKIIVNILLIVFLFSPIFSNNLIPKKHKGKWGFVDKNKNWVIKPKFDEVKPFKDGFACVKTKNIWGFINITGEKITKLKFSNVLPFSNGLAAVKSYDLIEGDTRASNNKKKWGFIDHNGNLVIPFMFKTAMPFGNNNMAEVQLFNMADKEVFMINKLGKPVSPPYIEKIKVNENYKIINKRIDGDVKVYKYITASGKSITDWYLNDFDISKDVIKVWLPSKIDNDTIETNAFKGNYNNKLCAYINNKGKTLTDWYSEIKPFIDGYAPIRHKYLYGFIDSNYNVVLKPTYREISLINSYTYKAQVEYGKIVLLNTKGDIKSLYCFDFKPYLDSMYLGMHKLETKNKKETKYAIFNKNYNQITGWYNKIHKIHNGIVRVEDNRRLNNTKDYITKYNYVNIETGQLISKWRATTYIKWSSNKKINKDSILNYLFTNRLNADINKYFLNSLFVKEVEINYKDSTITFSGGDFHNGMALVSNIGEERITNRYDIDFTKNDIGYGYIDWYGDLVIKYNFEEAAAFRDEYAVIGKNGKYGAINSKGRKIINETYNMLGAYGSGVFPFVNDSSMWGYINRGNRVQIKPIYDYVLPFHYGYASVKKGRFWGLIDVTGRVVMEFNYRKPIEIISPKRIRYLESGVGYKEISISEL